MGIQTASDSIVLNTGSPFGFKNRIVNGNMRIDQRYNGNSTYGIARTGGFTVDRMSYGNSSGTANTAQNLNNIGAPEGFTHYIGFQTNSAQTSPTTAYGYVLQYVEGYNVADLGWGTGAAATITLSFWVRSSITGAHGITFRNDNSASLGGDSNWRTYATTYTINQANTWEFKTITVPGCTTGNWDKTNLVGIGILWDLGTGDSSTYGNQTPNSGWTSPGTNKFGVVTGNSKVMATAGATFYLTGVQLEKGNKFTGFDHRPQTIEQMLCERYFEAWNYEAMQSQGMVNDRISCSCGFDSVVWFRHRTPKRVAPSISYTSLEGRSNTNQILTIGSTYPGIHDSEIALSAPTGGVATLRFTAANGALFLSSEL